MKTFNNFVITVTIRDQPFCKYAKFSEKLTSYPLIRTCTFAYQGVNISFLENFAYLLNA